MTGYDDNLWRAGCLGPMLVTSVTHQSSISRSLRVSERPVTQRIAGKNTDASGQRWTYACFRRLLWPLQRPSDVFTVRSRPEPPPNA